MKRGRRFTGIRLLLAAGGGLLLAVPGELGAHCDTLEGPVVMEAKAALAKGDVTPVLKWVRPEDEGVIREAFARTLKVWGMGPEAKDLADMYLFETLVRIHRVSEGEPYTGLKPAGAVEPGIAAADKALEQGTVEDLVEQLTHRIEEGIKGRFQAALKSKQHADESVEKGRGFVKAYVQFVHYIEALHQSTNPAGEHETHVEAKSESRHTH